MKAKIQASPLARTMLSVLTVIAISLAGALAVEQLASQAGVAHAEATPLDAPPALAPALVGSDGSAGSAVVEAPKAPVSTTPAAPTIDVVPDVSFVVKLWRSGAITSAAAVGFYLLLAFGAKVDKARAFYWTTGLTAVSVLVEPILRGETPTAAMATSAVATLLAILARGPAKPE